ncbi:pyridoxine 5'-phosphate synthase [Alkalispirochaeta odontotermitis]|nr:pyridoxine 5'-phosphate synthase [Alkalispirochaeta odontotermitis]CAB1071485.1 Pyridoxine 5'-phosphate synthase (EC [Olavius algarvensis Delta 1 endosymbiont]
MAGLAVKVDQVAVLRAVRKSQLPDPVTAAALAEVAGADGISAHLRKDRRYIKDRDVRILRSIVQSKLILEMASTTEMVGVALDIKPDLVTLVPEKREESSTDGGLDLIVHRNDINETVATLQNSGIPVGLMVDPDLEQIKLAHKSNATMVEIQTGAYCDAKTSQSRHQALLNIVDSIKLAHKLKLGVKAGRGLCYKTIKAFKDIPEIDEFSIGHSIVSRAILTGMQSAVEEMIRLIDAL